jgi:hypothetical protein
MAVQTPEASSRPIDWRAKHKPIGTTTCDTSVMYKGLLVSPVPCRPPVNVNATVMKNPDTLRYRSN